MKASLPSSDATISCGSGPAGMRARTCKVEGSTMATVLSLFASTRSANDDSCADAPLARTEAAIRHPTILTRLFFFFMSFLSDGSSLNKPNLQRSPRRRSRGPGPLKIKSAELASHVHYFANEKQTWNLTTFHCLG